MRSQSIATTTSSEASVLPVSLSEAKDHLRLVGDDLDAEVQAALEAATQYCEQKTSRVLRSTATIVQVHQEWATCYRIDREPLLAVTSVTYYDTDNTLQTVESSNYRIATSERGGSLFEFDADFTWPTLHDRSDPIRLTYTAGYAIVPAMAKQAVRLMTGYYFGDLDERQMQAAEQAASRLLAMCQWGSYR